MTTEVQSSFTSFRKNPPDSQEQLKTPRYHLNSTVQMYWIVLVVLLALTGGAGAVDEIMTKEQVKLPHDDIVLKTARHLRSYGGSPGRDINTNFSTEDDERAIEFTKLAKLDDALWRIRKLDMKLSRQMWIHNNNSPEEVFNRLRLSKLGIDIDESRKTIQWFRFVNDYRAARGSEEFSDYLIYEILKRKGMLSEAKIADLFQALAHLPDLKNLAEMVQNFQYRVWIAERKTPADVARMLMVRISGPRPIDIPADPRYTILDAYKKVYSSVHPTP